MENSVAVITSLLSPPAKQAGHFYIWTFLLRLSIKYSFHAVQFSSEWCIWFKWLLAPSYVLFLRLIFTISDLRWRKYWSLTLLVPARNVMFICKWFVCVCSTFRVLNITLLVDTSRILKFDRCYFAPVHDASRCCATPRVCTATIASKDNNQIGSLSLSSILFRKKCGCTLHVLIVLWCLLSEMPQRRHATMMILGKGSWWKSRETRVSMNKKSGSTHIGCPKASHNFPAKTTNCTEKKIDSTSATPKEYI